MFRTRLTQNMLWSSGSSILPKFLTTHSLRLFSDNCGPKMSPELIDAVCSWFKWDRNKKTKKEIKDLVECGEIKELEKRMMSRLNFGTAGLRGPMRAGFNGMNDLVVIQTSQGLCKYILEKFPCDDFLTNRGVVIGYDGRHNSKRFAELAACVFVLNGVRAWLFSQMVPTPFIPFTILKKECLAGVMVTASHNPKADNGYKVYWSNGSQIIPPHDENIQEAITDCLEPNREAWDTDLLEECDLCEDPFDEISELYLKSLEQSIPAEYRKINEKAQLNFVYTAMHGVGYPFIEMAFKRSMLASVFPVEEQCTPDPEFSTVAFPNPEEGKSSLDLAMELAQDSEVTTILANDPDADRLACAQYDDKKCEWKVFTGNELGALLGWWALQTYKTLDPDIKLEESYMLASAVSSKVLSVMAEAEGFKYEETLTGFKWMGNRAIQLMRLKQKVMFAFEEAIGYMFSTNVLDKDGISAACHLASMASYLKTKYNRSLLQQLQKIFEWYGYFINNNSYFICHEPRVIRRIFKRMRHFEKCQPKTYPKSVCGDKYPIKSVRDLTTGVDTSRPDGKPTLPIDPSSQMITFTFENGATLTFRASGTEPKIKYYSEIMSPPGCGDPEEMENELNELVGAAINELLEPERNSLTPKKED